MVPVTLNDARISSAATKLVVSPTAHIGLKAPDPSQGTGNRKITSIAALLAYINGLRYPTQDNQIGIFRAKNPPNNIKNKTTTVATACPTCTSSKLAPMRNPMACPVITDKKEIPMIAMKVVNPNVGTIIQ
mmetsp:Transcript_36646/g.40944  ORF Transcript_36646/g.40944 Transcript_36646/m.40944 type:complete len:131 (+) Transcript_36646:321-713(+)